jgi:hypothetical protein
MTAKQPCRYPTRSARIPPLAIDAGAGTIGEVRNRSAAKRWKMLVAAFQRGDQLFNRESGLSAEPY